MADQAIATQEAHPIKQFREQLLSRAGDIQMALPAGIGAEKFQRTVMTAVSQNQDLLKADRQSLILACYKAAQDGLVPDGREAALVTFNQRRKGPNGWETVKLVQYMPMVWGLRKKILQAKDARGEPVVSALEVGVVYRAEAEEGWFRYEVGTEPPLEHRPKLDLSEEQAADSEIVGAYSIATMADGTKSYEFMRRFEIDKVRQLSQTGATGRKIERGQDAGKAIEPKGPWVDWFPEMAKKTVMRRHSKTLPASGDVILDLGTEQDEIDANVSTAALLGSAPGGQPEAIEDLPPHNPETGEIDEEDQSQGASSSEDQPEAETKPARAKAKPNKPGAPEAKPEPEKAVAQEETPAEPQAEAGEAPQTGVTKDPFEAAADEFLDRFAKAANVVDLDAAHKEFEKESEGWPYEIVQAVAAGHARHRRRLAPATAQQTEPAK